MLQTLADFYEARSFVRFANIWKRADEILTEREDCKSRLFLVSLIVALFVESFTYARKHF